MWPVLLPFVILTAASLSRVGYPSPLGVHHPVPLGPASAALPTAYLAALVSLAGTADEDHSRQRAFICAGLVTSAVGDGLAAWQTTCAAAAVSQLAARALYVIAFDFRQLGSRVGVVCALCLLATLLRLLPALPERWRRCAVSLHGTTLAVLAWRAVVSYLSWRDDAQLAACVGVALLTATDVSTVVRGSTPVTRAMAVAIQGAYSAGQLAMALTVLLQSWRLMKIGGLI